VTSGDDIRISGAGNSGLRSETGSGLGSRVVKSEGDNEEKSDGTRRGSTIRLQRESFVGCVELPDGIARDS